MDTSEIVRLSYKMYLEFSSKINSDTTYESALKAAVLAPSVFMQNVKDFELTFDAITHHLEISLQRATNSDQISLIQRIAQELFHSHIYLIEQKIAYQRELNQRGFMKKVGDFFKGKASVNEPIFIVSGILTESVDILIGADVVLLIVSYFEKLYRDWQITNESNLFYVQLIRTYRKIAQSKVYNPQYTLINNTIDRNKIPIIDAITELCEWDEGIEFIAALEFRKPFSYTELKRRFFRKYRLHFIWRNPVSAYFFFSFIITASMILIIFSIFSNWEPAIKWAIILGTIFLSIYLCRYEHRLLSLKARIRQRIKELINQ